jgi:hypothetical protein
MNRPAAGWLLTTSAALALGACANSPVLVPAAVSAPTLACAKGQQPMRADLLYFGVPTPGADGGRAAFTDFVDEVVTPRFPDGLTAWPASGQWKPAHGPTVRESSWVLNVVHWPDAKSEAAIAAIVDQYKKRFHQESVLRVSSDACVTF